jgi:ATP-binding cassette subfamily F protein 3
MSLITINNLAKSFGPDDIFSDITASIPQRARIGLVGPNGVGKTTLLRILLGLDEPSDGRVYRARVLTSGYLPQEASFEESGELWTACLAVFEELRRQQAELEGLEKLMSDPVRAGEVMEKYGRLQHEFDLAGGYTYETRIRQTLTGLGFVPGDLRRPLSQLSGGQRTRALLARLLLSSPDLLLLDEPTNHLDIAAVEWLEDFLADWPGAALIVSHDRYFLDRVVNTVWEMNPVFETYHGNYSAYLRQREERYLKRLEEYTAQTTFVEKEEEYIRRNIAGQNTRQAQGRRKRLERLLEESRLASPQEARRLHLRLQPASRSGDLVLQTRGLNVGYADEGRPLFSIPDLTLRRGECAAILGPNGAGKTTFLKTLLNQIPPWQGEAELGASLKIGYFAQAHEGLQPNNTLMDEIQKNAPKMLPEEIRSYLARFLFSGDDVFKKVEVLSGGERGRLALACLALTGANLLLLDEPTNHLDLPSQEVLQSIMANFDGTILLVSHDRYLIDALATQIWDVRPAEKELLVFQGTYSEFKSEQRAAAEPPLLKKDSPITKSPAQKSAKNADRQRQQNLILLEQEISRLEAELLELGRRLETPTVDVERVQELGSEYVRVQGELEDLLGEWERNASGF